jgi:hypoxanthine phosphoribosyltransferase
MLTKFTWEDFDGAVKLLTTSIENLGIDIDNIYGIPRGGLVLAVNLSHKLGKPLIFDPNEITHNTLVVDETCDTGTTLSKINPALSVVIHLSYKASYIPTLYAVDKNDDDWILYPWETELTTHSKFRSNS